MGNVEYKSRPGKRTGRRTMGIFLLLILCAGCGPMYTKPTEREPATQAERNFRDLWDASCTTLKQYGFSLDRQDRREGVITTYTVSGGHGLEALWRKDASNVFYLRENTTQNILRAARVKIRRLPENPESFDFRVEVRMARTDRPQPQVTNAVEVNKMRVSNLPDLRFSDLQMRSLRGGEKLRGLQNYIVPLGEDEELAYRIDRSIRRRAGIADQTIREPQKDDVEETALPDVSVKPPKRTVILAGPLEEPQTAAPTSQPTTAPSVATVVFDETAPGTPHGQEIHHILCSLRTADGDGKTTTPVTMIFRLRNVGDAPVRLAEPKHGMTLFVRYRNVGAEDWDGAPSPESFELPGVAEIAPGKTLDVPVKFGFGAAGEYEIFFRYSARPGRDTNWSGDLDSNILKFTITGVK